MKRNTIKWRIFKYNIIVIIVLIALTTIVSNIAISLYIKGDITSQLNTIALRTEDTALNKGPAFFPSTSSPNMPPPSNSKNGGTQDNNDLFQFYFMLDRSLKAPLSVLNADYILLDGSKNIITTPNADYFKPSNGILNKVTNEIGSIKDSGTQEYMDFTVGGTEYVAIIKPVSGKNTFGLGWIVIYSSLQKVNQLQWGINAILFSILILSALIIAVISSLAAKKISAPFSSLNKHIGAIAERDFGTKISMPVDDELQEFVNNINTMSEKLESYDKAQKTFLQNASHEFRTPLMSIQSYAEGIKHDVVDGNTAADIIIDEAKRMTDLVDDLLYLSRLDAIEENYHFADLDLNSLLSNCTERINGIAAKNNISISADTGNEKVKIHADEEMMSRALINIIGNCIRYAGTAVNIQLKPISGSHVEVDISDDGPGIDTDELPNIFERFYKGRKGNFGLGLAISKNILDKHYGEISAENTGSGALFRIVLPIIKQQ